MIRTEKDILATLSAGAEWDAVALAEEVGICVKTVVRTLMKLQAAGIVCVTRGGGRGRKTTARILEHSKMRGTMSVFHRVYEDPADRRPGEEYTPVADIDAARADRARLMNDKAWRPRTKWARGG